MELTCIIVNYNNSEYLNEAVDSVFSQTMVPDEIIIADDCSTDGSRELLRHIEANYSNVRLILREENIGVSANRDLAIREAQGQYITTLDSDDWYHPQKLEMEYTLVRGQDNVVACSDIELVDESGSFDLIKVEEFCGLETPREQCRFMVARRRGVPRDVMMSKKIFMASEGMRHELRRYEDWDLPLQLINMGVSWRYSGVVGTAYRRIGTGLSAANQWDHLLDKLAVLWPRFLASNSKKEFFLGVNELFLIRGTRKLVALAKGDASDIL